MMLQAHKTTLAFFALVLLQACSMPTMMVDAESNDLLPGKVIVVGKFEMDPPLSKIEMDRKVKSGVILVGGKENYINTGYFSAMPQPVDRVDKSMRSNQWDNTLRARFGETYFKVTDAKKTYINSGMTFIDVAGLDKAWLPGGMSFVPPANAKAVYVGTVKYTRDDFWNITNIQIIDEYKKTKAEFEKRFGKSVSLEKALFH